MNIEYNFTGRDFLERAFERKRVAFLEDYRISEKPAWIWQFMPAQTLKIDPENQSLQQAIRTGAVGDYANNWWNGFQARQSISFVFDGLSSARADIAPGYATEVHTDGHIIIGLWTFPDNIVHQDGTKGLGVADFYSDAPEEAVVVARSIYASLGYEAGIVFTSTLHQANLLPMVNGRGNILAAASGRQTLRWSVSELGTPADLDSAGEDAARQFLRIYGRRLPRVR
jgi:hypothetical protein